MTNSNQQHVENENSQQEDKTVDEPQVQVENNYEPEKERDHEEEAKTVIDAAAQEAAKVLTPIAVSLKGNAKVREKFGNKWNEMSRDEKVKALSDPSILKRIFGGPWYSKHKVNQYTLGGLVLIGAIGGSAEDESVLEEVYSSTWAEKAIIALVNIGKFLDPQLVPLAEGMNVYKALKSKGIEVCKAVRNKSAIEGVQEELHETAAEATPDNVVPPHQRTAETNNPQREDV